MRQRAVALVTVAVGVAVLFLAIPGMLLGSYLIWKDAETSVEIRSQAVVEIVGRLEQNKSKVWINLLDSLAESSHLSGVHISVVYPDGQTVESTSPVAPSRFELRRFTTQGSLVTISAPRSAALHNIVQLIAGAVALVLAAFTVGAWVARRRANTLRSSHSPCGNGGTNRGGASSPTHVPIRDRRNRSGLSRTRTNC